jgi:hypothetical protein
LSRVGNAVGLTVDEEIRRVFLYRIGEGIILAIRTTYTHARATASELADLDETAHLLRSPKNAERLLKALEQARRGEGKPETVDELRRDLGDVRDES